MSKSKKNTLNVCLLGSPAAGKTCFIGGLVILSEPNSSSPFVMLSQGSCLQYLNEVAKTLKSGTWPAPTNVSQWIDAHFLFRGGDLRLTLLDYPGGVYKDQLATLDASERGELEQSYQEADVFLMLMDPESDILCYDGMSHQARNQIIDRQTAHLQHAMDCIKSKQGGKGRKISLGLVITKSDKYPEISSPSSALGFLEQHAPHFLNKLAEILKASAGIRVFAVSAVGNSKNENKNDRPPSSINPEGYEPLFTWLLKIQWWKKWTETVQYAAIISSVAATLLLGFLSWVGYNNFRYKAEMTSDLKSALTRLSIAPPQFPVFVNPGKIRQAVAEKEVERIESRIEGSISLSQVEENEDLLKKIIASNPPRINRFEGLTEKSKKKSANLLFKMIENEKKDTPGRCMDHCTIYLTKYPEGEDAEKVKDIKNELVIGDREKDMQAIKLITCSDVKSMLSKAGLVENYLAKYNPKDAKKIKMAIGLARQVANANQYTLSTKEINGLQKSYDIYAKFTVNNELSHTLKSTKAGFYFQWPDDTFVINWKVGDRIAIEVWEDGIFWDYKIADFPFSDEFDSLLKLMDPALVFEQTVSYPNENEIKVKIEITAPDGDNITPERHQAFRDYIHPGKSWENLEVK